MTQEEKRWWKAHLQQLKSQQKKLQTMVIELAKEVELTETRLESAVKGQGSFEV